MLLLLIAISVSIDSLIVGISFGVKKVKISSMIYTFICSFLLLYSLFANIFAHSLLSFFTNYQGILKLLQFSGNIFIVLLGFYYIWQNKKESEDNNKSINLFANPSAADRDNSGFIDIFESLIMSFALSIDNILAIMSLTFSNNMGKLPSLLFGIIQSLFLITGIVLGKVFNQKLGQKVYLIRLLPGYVLILAGIIRFFT